tara:strand:- start:3318 stop:3545 length:228 start_codon:yes stop_codon:yes gene_type:complete
MSAFTRMADSYEEVEAENGQLHMQVRKLKAQNAELLAVAERLKAWGKVAGPDQMANLADIIHDANAAIAKAKGGE